MADGYPSRASGIGTTMSQAQLLTAQNGGKVRMRYQQDGTWTIEGVTTQTFFGPMQPLVPLAQDPSYGAIGRQFDYQTGYNLNYTPRANLRISFAELRGFAQACNILATVIETRKDQLLNLDWTIQPRDKKKKPDADCAKIQTFLEYPNKQDDFGTWARPLLDDMFVGDCLTIYPHLTNGGQLYALDYMDGATIFPMIDESGRIPKPPSPAYQQITKGVPAVDYMQSELIYRPRNKLTHRVYGYSPVEQIVMTVNVALRRELFRLDYYTAGSIPDAFATAAKGWNTAQIKEFQQFWDSIYENGSGQNSAQRRKMRWLPADTEITFAKDAILKDMFDEWLARIICFAFSIAPTPFVAQVNRATAETAQEQSLAEGLGPLKKYWQGVMNYIIAFYFKRPDLCFEFKEEDAQDPLTQAQVLQIYVQNGIVDDDEAREVLGMDPKSAEQRAKEEAAAAPPTDPNAPSGKPEDGSGKPKPEPSSAAEKLAKFGGERKAVMIQRQRLTRSVKRALKDQASTIAAQMAAHLGKAALATLAKASDDPPSDWETWFDWDAIFAPMVDAVADPLTRTSADAAAIGVSRLPQSVSAGISLQPGFVNDYARDYAADRGAEMIGKRYVDGELVDNPDAKWRITDETREAVRKSIAQGIADGWTLDEFSTNLASDYAFSADRADVIGRTETRLADTRGQVAAWKESGVVAKKEWLLSEDEPCDDCVDNADAGAIDLDDVFPSGDDAPPLHPNCRCVVAPVTEGL